MYLEPEAIEIKLKYTQHVWTQVFACVCFYVRYNHDTISV